MSSRKYKRLILILFCITSTYLSAQPTNLDWYVGTWKYENISNGDEIIVKLKKGIFNIPIVFGGGVEDCLVGVYSYKKNNQLLINNLERINEQQNYSYPIQLLPSSINPTEKFLFSIIDYTIQNGNGKFKYIYSAGSFIELNTISPKTIKWKLVVEEQEYFYYEQIDRFPEGTNLPLEIILTKIE